MAHRPIIKETIQLSRRSILKGVVGSVAAGLGRSRVGFTVQMVMPPPWIAEAHEIIRNVRRPRIPNLVMTLQPSKEDARAAIQKAIDHVSDQGGGRVILTAGTWRSNGSIHLRSRVELHLQEGADVVFSGDRRCYLPVVHTRWEGTELYGYSPCLYAYRVHDVAITGRGTLSVDRNGDMEDWRAEQTEAQKRLRLMGAHAVPLSQRVFGEGSFLRPSFIQLFGCERVLIEDISIGSIPFWGIHLVFSKDCVVRSITVDSRRVNNDGVDIDSSCRVVIENCTFNTGDDCIAIKSGRDLDGRVAGQPSEDIVIRDCRMSFSKSAGIAIGSEMSGGVRRVYVMRCTMGNVDAAINVKANLDRGGCIEYVRAWDISIRECDSIVHITTAYHGYMGGHFPPTLEDIELEDIECARTKRVVVIRGHRDSIVRRVKIRQVQVANAKRFSEISNVDECFCEDVVVAGVALTAQCKARDN